MREKKNYFHRGNQLSGITVQTVSSISNNKSFPVKLNLSSNSLKAILDNGHVFAEILDEEDFFETLQHIQAKLGTFYINLKICGNCHHFGFSSMAYQFSGGSKGYCIFVKGPNDGGEDIVHVLDICDCFHLRLETTDNSPWLSP